MTKQREVSDDVMDEFTKETLAFQKTCGLTDAEMAGMLMGAGVSLARSAGMSKIQVVTTAAKIFEKS